MKKIVLSLLTVTALGATLVGTQTAEAEGWVGSGWYDVGQGAAIGNGTNWEHFIVALGVGAPQVAAGTTRAANITAFVEVPGATNSTCFPEPNATPPGALCPTTFAAATLCQNNDMIIGNWVFAANFPGEAYNNSDTSNTTGTNAAYYLASGQQWLDTGYCPVFQPQIRGGAFIYQY